MEVAVKYGGWAFAPDGRLKLKECQNKRIEQVKHATLKASTKGSMGPWGLLSA
jgi:hypothetical protein